MIAMQAAMPRPAAIAITLILGLSLAGALVGRLNGPVDNTQPQGAVVASRDLRFADQANGGVAITDAGNGAYIATMAPGTNGFLRATLRGLARYRRLDGQGAALPFRLTSWSDGRLTLEDLATGHRVELEAFGSANEAVFSGLLTRKEAPP
jgi:putative photosynthetic complex assembly protein